MPIVSIASKKSLAHIKLHEKLEKEGKVVDWDLVFDEVRKLDASYIVSSTKK